MTYIDTDLAMSFLMNNKNLYKTISQSFLDNYSDFPRRIVESFKKGDYESVISEVHSLKGMTLNFGAQYLYDSSVLFIEELRDKKYKLKSLDSYIFCFEKTYSDLEKIVSEY